MFWYIIGTTEWQLSQDCFFNVRLTTSVIYFCPNFKFSNKSLEFSGKFLVFDKENFKYV